MSINNKRVAKEIHKNPNLVTMAIDGIQAYNNNKSKTNLVRLISSLPEGAYEQSRFIVTDEHLKHFIDVLCRTIDYFPKKPNKSKSLKSLGTNKKT